MPHTREIDIFENNPFYSVKNTGYYKQKKGWRWKSVCDYACFYCIADGAAELLINGNHQHAERGDVIFLRSRDNGAIISTSDSEVAYYFVSFYFNENTSLGIDSVVKNTPVTDLFKEIRRVHHSEAYLYKLKGAGLFLQIVYRLATATISKNKSYSSHAGLRSAAEYVNVNYYKKISVNELSAVSNYSPSHLRRLFLKHYGVSPQDYITSRKLSAVKDILIEAPEKSIEEIAELLSFCSASYLCKLFKKHYGASISDYKKLGISK